MEEHKGAPVLLPVAVAADLEPKPDHPFIPEDRPQRNGRLGLESQAKMFLPVKAKLSTRTVTVIKKLRAPALANKHPGRCVHHCSMLKPFTLCFSKRAREERALAVERRLKAMQSKCMYNACSYSSQCSCICKAGIASSSSISQPLKAENSEAESDSDAEVEVCETDGDRRKTMQDAAQINDIDDLKFKFIAGFQFKFPTNGDSKMPTSRATGSTSSTASPSHSKGKGKLTRSQSL